jgi:hypothetical protein
LSDGEYSSLRFHVPGSRFRVPACPVLWFRVGFFFEGQVEEAAHRFSRSCSE